jgi:hypothetical protein
MAVRGQERGVKHHEPIVAYGLARCCRGAVVRLVSLDASKTAARGRSGMWHRVSRHLWLSLSIATWPCSTGVFDASWCSGCFELQHPLADAACGIAVQGTTGRASPWRLLVLSVGISTLLGLMQGTWRRRTREPTRRSCRWFRALSLLWVSFPSSRCCVLPVFDASCLRSFSAFVLRSEC